MKRTLFFASAFAVMTLTGCASNTFNMQLMAPATEPVVATSSEATVTFYRPDDGTSYFCPIVTQVDENNTRFVVTIARAQKHTVAIPAGQHIFAFLGEQSHILQGFFREGKHYYVKLNYSEGLYGSIFKPTVHAITEQNIEKKLPETLSALTAIVPTKRAQDRYQTYEEQKKAYLGMREAKSRGVSGENAFISKINAFDHAL